MPLFPLISANFIADYIECNVKFLQNSYGEAKLYCERVLKEKPNPYTVENLITLAYRSKDKKLLEKLINFLERRKYNKVYLYEAKAFLYLLENNGKGFVENAEKALIYGSKNRLLIYKVLSSRYFMEDWKLTILTIFSLYSLEPNNGKMENISLKVFLQKPEIVLEVYKRLRFKDENITLLVAKFLNLLGKEREALKLAKEVLKENPQSDRAKKLLIEIYLKLGDTERALKIADNNGLLKRFFYKKLFLNYSYRVGKKLFFSALKDFPEDRELVSTLLTFALSQKWEEGVLKSGELYAKLVVKPSEEDLKLLVGYFIAEISAYGDIKEKKLLEKLKKAFPESGDLKLVEALLEFKKGNNGYLDILREIDPEALTPLYRPVYEALKLYTLNEGKLRKELQKLEVGEFEKLLHAFYRVLSPLFAKKLTRLYLELNPSREAFGLTFITFNKLGDLELQREVLEEAVKHYPNDAAFLNSLGYTYLLIYGKGGVKKAKPLLEKALKLEPNDPATIDSLGWAYFLEGNYEKAQMLLKKALEGAPNDPVVNYLYGQVLLKLKRPCEAEKYLKKSLNVLENSLKEPEEGITKRVEEALKEAERLRHFKR